MNALHHTSAYPPRPSNENGTVSPGATDVQNSSCSSVDPFPSNGSEMLQHLLRRWSVLFTANTDVYDAWTTQTILQCWPVQRCDKRGKPNSWTCVIAYRKGDKRRTPSVPRWAPNQLIYSIFIPEWHENKHNDTIKGVYPYNMFKLLCSGTKCSEHPYPEDSKSRACQNLNFFNTSFSYILRATLDKQHERTATDILPCCLSQLTCMELYAPTIIYNEIDETCLEMVWT